MKIELKAIPGRRGAKSVWVDGEQWGIFSHESHGPRGYSLTLENMTRNQIYRIGKKVWHGSHATERRPVVVPSEKYYLRRLPHGETPIPMDARLEIAVRSAIEDGIFKHPLVVQEERRRAEERRDAEMSAHRSKEQEEFTAKARAAIGNLSLDEASATELAARIEDAMRWAQTK